MIGGVLAVHFLLGAANLVFWPSYAAFGIVPAGVASTAAHVAFVLAHTAALIALRRWSGPARTP